MTRIDHIIVLLAYVILVAMAFGFDESVIQSPPSHAQESPSVGGQLRSPSN